MKRSYNICNQSKNMIHTIFREYEKSSDKFIATNNFFISEKLENGSFAFKSFNNHKNNKKDILKPYGDCDCVYTSLNDNQYYLIVISNISFSLDDINIHKKDIFKKFIDNNKEINEQLLEDLYYNEDFSKKINLELPKKYDNKSIYLEDIEINTRYLFKINIIELEKSFSNELYCE